MNTDTELLRKLVAEWRQDECLNGLVQRTVDKECEARCRGQCADQLEAALSRLFETQAGVPEEWQLVPKIPTGKMRDYGSGQCSGTKFETGFDVAENVYRAMLAAAPQLNHPPSEGEQ